MGKIWSWLLLLAVALVFTAGPALAQDNPPPKKQHGAHMSPEDQFKKWDANGDGKVTLDELKAAMPGKEPQAEKRFKAIAGDKDSFTLEDLKAYIAAHPHGKKGGDKPADKPAGQ